MKPTQLLPLALLGLTLAALADINIALHNGNTTVSAMTTRPDGTLVATSVDTWNNPKRNGAGGQGLSFTGFALADTTGAATTATLDATSGFTSFNNNGWGNGTQDSVMMEGWYGFRDAEFLTVNDLPADLTSGGYSVIIYGDSNNTLRTMDYFIDGVKKTIEDAGTFGGTFSLGDNYVVFGGLSASSFTITGNTTSAGRSAINGIQIVAGDLSGLEITSFTASGLFVAPGSMVTLDWAVKGADLVTLDPGGMVVTGTTTTDVTVDTDTTFTLTATDTTEPASVSSSLTVRVAPVINLFETAGKTARDSGDFRLVWETIGAETLTISDGTTDVFTTSDPVEAASGFTMVTGVTTDTTFTLTATFPGGNPATAQSSVDIRSGADPVGLEETIMADGVFAYYRFEENSAAPAVLLDSSGNQRDSLSISADGVTTAQPGAVGSAWSFANGSVELDLNPDPSTTSFSVALLAQMDDPREGGVNSLVSQQNLSGNGRSIVQTRPDTDSFTTWFGGGRKDLGAVSGPGDWAHVVLVYDHLDQELRLYTDGVLVSTTAGVVGETTMGNFILAANKGRNAEFLTGALDEVAVFLGELDDPDGNGDFADSRIPNQYAAYLRDAAPLLGFSASSLEISQGQSVDLTWKVGDAATSIAIDNEIGDVTGLTSNGVGTTSASPATTTTYTITVNGTETRQLTVVVNLPILITPAGFNASDEFEVVAINLVEGTDYDLFWSDDLQTFLSVGVQITADATGTATFVDTLADPSTNPFLFYRVEEVGP